MKKELQQKLFTQFDHMFRERHLDSSKTRMCDGFCIGDGWIEILWDLCSDIQDELDKHPKLKKQFAVRQVKSKFGTMRFYTNMCNDTISRLIDEAEHQSSKTCEYCGREGKSYSVGGYLETLCLKCLRKYTKKEAIGK